MVTLGNALARGLGLGLLTGVFLFACQGPEEFLRAGDDGGLPGFGGSPPGTGGDTGTGGNDATGGVTGTGGRGTGGGIGTGGGKGHPRGHRNRRQTSNTGAVP